MDDVLVETASGRIRPGIVTHLISSSHGKSWRGFFVRESGPVASDERDIILLKHAVFLQLNEPGQIAWSADNQQINKVIEPGQVSVCPANKLHSGSFRHNGRHITVLFEPGFLVQAVENDGAPPEVDLRWEFGIDSPALRELILLLYAESTRAGADDHRYANAIARLIAIHLVKHHSAGSSKFVKRGGLSPVRLKKVKDYIEDTIGGDISLQALASVAGLSLFHFSRAFRQSTGLSPFQYILKSRVSRARDLLLAPFARIQDVALECGFCDQAHLTRHFKRFTGTTPAAFARTIHDRGNLQSQDRNAPSR